MCFPARNEVGHNETFRSKSVLVIWIWSIGFDRMTEMHREQNHHPKVHRLMVLPNAMARSLKALKYQPLEGLIYLSPNEPWESAETVTTVHHSLIFAANWVFVDTTMVKLNSFNWWGPHSGPGGYSWEKTRSSFGETMIYWHWKRWFQHISTFQGLLQSESLWAQRPREDPMITSAGHLLPGVHLLICFLLSCLFHSHNRLCVCVFFWGLGETGRQLSWNMLSPWRWANDPARN